MSVCKGWVSFAADVTADFSFGLTQLSSESQRLTLLCVSNSAFKHKTSILTSFDDLKGEKKEICLLILKTKLQSKEKGWTKCFYDA